MKFAAFVTLLTVAATATAAPVKKKPVAKKTGASSGASPARNSSMRSAAPSKGPTSIASRKRGRKQIAAAPHSVSQRAPSQDRYREIQQALAAKGYLKSEPNGVWDAQSADAMRQFQTENNLPPTGKLTSAGLIALGLGHSSPQSASSTASENTSAPPQTSAPPR